MRLLPGTTDCGNSTYNFTVVGKLPALNSDLLQFNLILRSQMVTVAAKVKAKHYVKKFMKLKIFKKDSKTAGHITAASSGVIGNSKNSLTRFYHVGDRPTHIGK